MPGYAQYRDPTDTTRTPSPVIWADCPTEEMDHNPAVGQHFFDDFIEAELIAAGASAIEYRKYSADLDTGVVVARVADQDHGVVQCNTMDTVEDGGVITYGNQAGFARFGYRTLDQVWFECRFQVASIETSELGFFIGLAEINVSPTAAATLVDTTLLPNTTEDFVGFQRLTSGTTLECMYQEGSASRIDVGDAIETMVIATNYKVGMRYRGGRGNGGLGVLEYFLNGAIVQTVHVTDALNFPDTNHMAMVWAFKSGLTTGTNATMNLDWWKVASVGGNV